MKKTALLLALTLSTLTASAQFEIGFGRSIDSGHHRGHRPHWDVPCTGEWQELWNGCHVRLKNDRIYIYEYDGDQVVWGDEILLLTSGKYKVRRGSWWRIYEEDGDSTGICGDEILSWWNGTYCVRRGNLWRVYDRKGDWLGNVHSNDYIELLWNGCYLYKSGNYYYVADEKGERIFEIWGEEVILMDNGLFRVRRGNWVRYYDQRGEERN